MSESGVLVNFPAQMRFDVGVNVSSASCSASFRLFIVCEFSDAMCMSSAVCFATIVLTLLLTPILGTITTARQCTAAASGTYRVWVTSFESVNTGDLVISRR
jgi:hypothetical protein